MDAQSLQTVQNTFEKCFRDSAIFIRSGFSGRYFEADEVRWDNKSWIVIAAGLDEGQAGKVFRGNQNRAEKSLAPLYFRGACEMSLLFVARPFHGDPAEISPLSLVTPFAPQQGIRWLELREAYIRLWGIPTNTQGLSNIRWEWDLDSVRDTPRERWLRDWTTDLGFNPAHSPSHLHLNSTRIETGQGSHFRFDDSPHELRLAIGRPNPLALILSIAVWLRSLS